MPFVLEKVQHEITREGIDGWLFYDFQGLDPIARRILSIDPHAHLTRRWFYLIPNQGNPKKLVHKIEPFVLDHVPGETLFYAGWRELEQGLKKMLKELQRVAMHYSPKNAIPYISRVDGGTLELVKTTGVKIYSAADLIQQFDAVWTQDQLKSHIYAAKTLRSIVDQTFGYIAKMVSSNKKISEFDTQQFILEQFKAKGLHGDGAPIVATGPNSGNPHYSPQKDRARIISEGELVLIDIWAKEKKENAVYADITWTGFVGKKVPEQIESVFQIVRGARDAAFQKVQSAFDTHQMIKGSELDDVARSYIQDHGYGDAFIHRTGHNIGVAVHGNGANIDHFETDEQRKLIHGTCFSIEPGIYLKEFGIRSEIDVFIGDDQVHVYGQPIQTSVIPIMNLL